MTNVRRGLGLCLLAVLIGVLTDPAQGDDVTKIRVGLIGLDNSHAVAFTNSLNAQTSKPGLEGARVVAAFPGGSPDLPVSINRVAGFSEKVSQAGVKIVDSIEALVKEVDAVIITSVDGRVHPAQAKEVIAAGKPVFIDKPLAISSAEGKEIFEFARQKNVPCFSSSSLRYCKELEPRLKDNPVMGCEVYSPCSVLPHHPDLFFYGIHGIETLYTVMGPGCQSVTCVRNDGTDIVVGVWNDGRIGTFRGKRTGATGFGATVFGKGRIEGGSLKPDYDLLLVEIARFFRTGEAPVPAETTLEILAFMEAANTSHQQGGVSVPLKK